MVEPLKKNYEGFKVTRRNEANINVNVQQHMCIIIAKAHVSVKFAT